MNDEIGMLKSFGCIMIIGLGGLAAIIVIAMLAYKLIFGAC